MADIGKSTTSHASGGTESERHVLRLLRNWGDWVSCIPQPGSLEITLPPMFKDYMAGYRLTSGGRTPENVDAAEKLDRVLATLKDRDKACLVLGYVVQLSARKSSDFLKRYDAANNYAGKYACSDKTFTLWLGVAEANAEMKIMLAEGLGLSQSPVRGMRKTLRKVG